jgi:glycerophosphoryl diester phosphodiesterase
LSIVNSVVAQETADGELVVFHDEQSIARVCEDTASTAGHRRIRDMQAAEVKTLTLRRPPARPDSVAATLSRGSGGAAAAAARVPTLAEFLYGKRVFGAVFIRNMIVLPRQARDKDGESSEK